VLVRLTRGVREFGEGYCQAPFGSSPHPIKSGVDRAPTPPRDLIDQPTPSPRELNENRSPIRGVRLTGNQSLLRQAITRPSCGRSGNTKVLGEGAHRQRSFVKQNKYSVLGKAHVIGHGKKGLGRDAHEGAGCAHHHLTSLIASTCLH
jgi:hypothetical protein